MQSEQEYVLDQFRANFHDMTGKKFAIYGLGPNTKALLEVYGESQPVVALMDGMRTGETVWELPVVTCDEAASMGVEAILIIARASNLAVIYRRIEDDCKRLGIPVYDINGRLMEKPDKEARQRAMEFYRLHGEEELRKKIDCCDVISFDIFDTLLMRDVLYPEDIFELVRRKAISQGILPEGTDFAKARRNAERELYLQGQPDIKAIYKAMAEKGEIPEALSGTLLDMEIQEELRHILPRQSIAEVFRYAKEQGKTVVCTSDMYLPGEILRQLLEKCGVLGAEEIFVSCEAGCHKGTGLFDVLKKRYPHKKILHVGDNEDADIKGAVRYGIDETFLLRSAVKMLEDSPSAGLLKFTGSLEDRLVTGGLLAKYLNDPFLFRRTAGRLEIKSAHDMGQDYLEPMMVAFLHWLVERCRADRIDMLLLGARDGWMMTRLLDIYSQDRKLPFEYRYIPASRTACTVAGVETEADVEFAASHAFSGTAEEMLEKRFLLGRGEILPREPQEEDKAYIIRHANIILTKAKVHRRNYIAAMDNLGVKAGQKKAYFDFVSSGSCQLWLEKILGEKLKGYAYARFILPGKEYLDMEAFMAEVFPMQGETGCQVLGNYLFVESLISAPEPFLLDVEQGGILRFDEERRSEETLAQLKDAQQGMTVRFRGGIDEAPASKELGDFLAGMLKKECSFLAEGNVGDDVLIDEFCNREFPMWT